MNIGTDNNLQEQKTEVISGIENIIKTSLTRFSLTKHTIDSCIDKDNPKTIMTQNRIVTAIIDINNRGIRTRIITEITRDNISYCKDLINLNSEVRHLEDVIGNFSISDRSIYQATAMGDFSRVTLIKRQGEKLEPEAVTESIYSTMNAFVAQQQYFFDMLWKKAIPAKQRIKEIEEGLKREFIETIHTWFEKGNFLGALDAPKKNNEPSLSAIGHSNLGLAVLAMKSVTLRN